MTVRIFPGFVTPKECSAITTYACAVRPQLRPNRPHRYFRWLSELQDVAKEIREIEYRIWDVTGFTSAERDDVIRHYLSVNEPGGAIHLHTDPGHPGCVNTRFNLMVKQTWRRRSCRR